MESENSIKTDVKSITGIAVIRLDQAVRMLYKQLANDYLMFINVHQSRLRCCTSLVGANHLG